MKIILAIILIQILISMQSFADNINSHLYQVWRLKMDKLVESRTISKDLAIGFTSWDLKAVERWPEYQKLCNSKDNELSAFLFKKIEEGELGDHFLAHIYCFRENIDIEKLLEKDFDGNIYHLSEALLKFKGGE